MADSVIDYTKLLRKLDPEEDGEGPIRVRVGIVDAINANGTVDLGLSGVVIPDVPRLESAEIDVGANVQVLSYLGSLLVLGRVGTHGPPWLPYTVGSSGWTPGSAVLDGKYQVDRSKNILYGMGTITFAANTSVSGNMIVGIPSGFPPVDLDHPHIGTGLIIQGSNRFPFSVELNNSTSFIMVLGSGLIVDSDSPGTWANGHIIRFQYFYEIET